MVSFSLYQHMAMHAQHGEKQLAAQALSASPQSTEKGCT